MVVVVVLIILFMFTIKFDRLYVFIELKFE